MSPVDFHWDPTADHLRPAHLGVDSEGFVEAMLRM